MATKGPQDILQDLDVALEMVANLVRKVSPEIRSGEVASWGQRLLDSSLYFFTYMAEGTVQVQRGREGVLAQFKALEKVMECKDKKKAGASLSDFDEIACYKWSLTEQQQQKISEWISQIFSKSGKAQATQAKASARAAPRATTTTTTAAPLGGASCMKFFG